MNRSFVEQFSARYAQNPSRHLPGEKCPPRWCQRKGLVCGPFFGSTATSPTPQSSLSPARDARVQVSHGLLTITAAQATATAPSSWPQACLLRRSDCPWPPGSASPPTGPHNRHSIPCCTREQETRETTHKLSLYVGVQFWFSSLENTIQKQKSS